MLHTKMFYHYLFDLITIVWYCYWNLWTMTHPGKIWNYHPWFAAGPRIQSWARFHKMASQQNALLGSGTWKIRADQRKNRVNLTMHTADSRWFKEISWSSPCVSYEKIGMVVTIFGKHGHGGAWMCFRIVECVDSMLSEGKLGNVMIPTAELHHFSEG